MTEYFFMALAGLALVELVKGLSANGTPPVLQSFSWQMDLAHFMWSNILFFRIILGVAIAWMFTQISAEARMGVVPGAVVILALWGFIYWLFNRYWVGRFKFLPITQKRFEGAATNKVGLKEQILGINHNGEAKAFPVNMLYYHHQIADEVGGHPIWPTYCGLCNSGRIYDRQVDGNALEFTLVGAVNYNATFRDHTTGKTQHEIATLNIDLAWENLKLKYEAFDFRNEPVPQLNAIRTFVKKQLAAGHVVVMRIQKVGNHFPIARRFTLQEGSFSHIVPFVGLMSDHPLTDPTWYDDDYIVHYHDHDVVFVHRVRDIFQRFPSRLSPVSSLSDCLTKSVSVRV